MPNTVWKGRHHGQRPYQWGQWRLFVHDQDDHGYHPSLWIATAPRWEGAIPDTCAHGAEHVTGEGPGSQMLPSLLSWGGRKALSGFQIHWLKPSLAYLLRFCQSFHLRCELTIQTLQNDLLKHLRHFWAWAEWLTSCSQSGGLLSEVGQGLQ